MTKSKAAKLAVMTLVQISQVLLFSSTSWGGEQSSAEYLQTDSCLALAEQIGKMIIQRQTGKIDSLAQIAFAFQCSEIPAKESGAMDKCLKITEAEYKTRCQVSAQDSETITK